MSTSPTDSSYSAHAGHKRRRTNELNSPQSAYGAPPQMAAAPSQESLGGMSQQPPPPPQIPPGHIPKRGARACTACRKGKNRCEGEVRGPRPAPRGADSPY